jgi:hypothetical protein
VCEPRALAGRWDVDWRVASAAKPTVPATVDLLRNSLTDVDDSVNEGGVDDVRWVLTTMELNTPSDNKNDNNNSNNKVALPKARVVYHVQTGDKKSDDDTTGVVEGIWGVQQDRQLTFFFLQLDSGRGAFPLKLAFLLRRHESDVSLFAHVLLQSAIACVTVARVARHAHVSSFIAWISQLIFYRIDYLATFLSSRT